MIWRRGQIMSASDVINRCPLCWMKNHYLSVRWTRIDPFIFIPCLPWLIGWIIWILYSTTFQLKKKAKILFSFLKNVGKSAFLGLKKKFQQWKYLHRYLFWITHPTRYQLGALSKREVKYLPDFVWHQKFLWSDLLVGPDHRIWSLVPFQASYYWQSEQNKKCMLLIRLKSNYSKNLKELWDCNFYHTSMIDWQKNRVSS